MADLHIHSPYARGTSKQLTFDNLARWARLKGIDVLATGDFTHPARFEETRAILRDGGNGMFTHGGVHFVLGTEVNCNAEQDGRKRRVHLLILAPSFETAARINGEFSTRGKLGSDGRPTLHLSPRELVEALKGIDDRVTIIPAHVWTPWFGLLGSKSGFDSLEECFGDLVGHVNAVETGLSSDPAMNWRIPSLDNVSLVSFSDAHSLPKLGREATVFPGVPSYDGMVDSLKTGRIEYTVEFFPEEGKYHFSGHRKCDTRLSPSDVATGGAACPECGRRITLGVMQRVEELAQRDVRTRRDLDGYSRGDGGRPPFKTLVSLSQIIAESLGIGPNTKKVQSTYLELVTGLGNELAVLTEASVAEVARLAGERTAEGVLRVREGNIAIEPGFDGQYGTVRVWPVTERQTVHARR